MNTRSRSTDVLEMLLVPEQSLLTDELERYDLFEIQIRTLIDRWGNTEHMLVLTM